MSTFETISVMIAFGMFTIEFIGLIVKIVENNKK